MGLSVHCRCFLFPGPCDYWNFDSWYPCLYVGGCYSHNSNYGLFYVNYNAASNYDGSIGCRFLFDISNLTYSWHGQPHTSR